MQIVYVSIMGTVMMAAFLEWFLWLAAFLYCLIKVFIKAEHWSIRILAVVMMIGFSLLRSVQDYGIWSRRLLTPKQTHFSSDHGRHSSSSIEDYPILS